MQNSDNCCGYNINVVPDKPIGFNFSVDSNGSRGIDFIFEWDLPLGNDTGSVVDVYTLTITSINVTSYTTTVPYLKVTLDYNVLYTARVAALNCAGLSPESINYTFRYGMYIKILM